MDDAAVCLLCCHISSIRQMRDHALITSIDAHHLQWEQSDPLPLIR